MRFPGLQAGYQVPMTSQPHPERWIFPYRLEGLAIIRPMTCCADITRALVRYRRYSH